MPSPRGLLLVALVVFALAVAGTALWLAAHAVTPVPHAHLVPPVVVPGAHR